MSIRKVGDQVFVARWQIADVRETCPVCFGKRVVRVILGDDSEVEIDCAFCASGLNQPCGTVSTWRRVPRVETRTITSVRTEQTEDGEKAEYMSEYYILHPEDCFDNEADALKRATGKAEAEEKAEFENFLRRVNDNQTLRSYAWAAGYHMTEAKRDRASAERHDRACRVCKERRPAKEAK